jgi:putative transposase
MTDAKLTDVTAVSKVTLLGDPDFLKEIVRATLQEVLEAEMTDALGAGKGERSEGRRGYRSGYYNRTLVTRVGKLELRVPQDRDGRFSTELFARYQRSEQALVSTLAEMYVQGVSTRKVRKITEELCGHAFSASAISQVNKTLDERLAAFAARRLEEAFPYLVLDARYERVREGGVVRSQAVHIAVGIDWDGRRQILGVELSARESRSSWKDFIAGLITRGLHGVEFVVADDHAGLRAALRETLPEAAYQRCYVHFLRNARDHLPRKADDDCLQELRWMYERRDLAEAKADLAAWLTKWEARPAGRRLLVLARPQGRASPRAPRRLPRHPAGRRLHGLWKALRARTRRRRARARGGVLGASPARLSRRLEVDRQPHRPRGAGADRRSSTTSRPPSPASPSTSATPRASARAVLGSRPSACGASAS